MSSPTTIVRLDAELLDVDLTVPFGIASGAQPRANNVLVRVILADGTCGLGEAAPFPAVTGETQASTLAALDGLRPRVLGADALSWRALADAWREAAPAAKAARCALEVALLDAWTKRAGIALRTSFGGVESTLRTGMTVTTGDVAEARDAAQDIADRGIATFKIKVGATDWSHDVERVVAVRDVAPRGRILLDGNGGLAAADALRLVRELDRHEVPIALFEQPCAADDLDGMARVTHGCNVPVCADESVTTPADALALVRSGACAAFNIKLMKSGVAHALAIASIAKAAGYGLMIGGMVETVLAMSASACFAAGLGGFAYVDLDTPMFMRTNPFRGGYVQRGDVLDLTAIESGHGVRELSADATNSSS